MTTEQEFFLKTLSDHMNRKETAPCAGVDWNALYHIAYLHRVGGIVFYQCKEFIPEPFYTRFKKSYWAVLYNYKNRENVYRKIDESFTTAGIQHFNIKGFEVAACYPVPALRAMSDLDMVVLKADRKQAGEILKSKGFIPEGDHAPDYDWEYDCKGLHYELHHQLIYDEVVTKPEQAKFFNDCWKYVKEGKLDWNFHFLFLIAHLRKHMLNSGAGFRMFMDLAAVIHQISDLNWPWIEEKLDLLRMTEFSNVCFALIEKWFRVKAPVDYPQLEVEFSETATERIFANGIFGFNSENNKINAAANGILRHENRRGLSRAHILARHMFPKYKHMRYIPAYSYIDGRPWLLLSAWIWRYMRFFMGKTSGTKSTLNKVKTSNEIVDEREEELRKWGLI